MITYTLADIGRHRIIHGDAFNHTSYEILMQDEKASAIITDPPFNLYRYEWIDVARQHVKTGSPIFILGSDKQIIDITRRERRDAVRNYFVFLYDGKPHKIAPGQPLRRADLMIHLSPQPTRPRTPLSNTLPVKKSYRQGHSQSKNPEPFKELIEAYTDKDDIILDPFSGAGGVAIAAERTGRKCYMIEKELRNLQMISTNLKEEAVK